MSDLNEWLKERRAIHDAAKEDAARVLWEHDDPEGESPNENFEDEPKWERERLKQAAQAVLESSDAHNNLPAALTMIEDVLELHTETVHGECAICFECTYDDGYEVDYSPFDYPCPTVQSVRSAIERSE